VSLFLDVDIPIVLGLPSSLLWLAGLCLAVQGTSMLHDLGMSPMALIIPVFMTVGFIQTLAQAPQNSLSEMWGRLQLGPWRIQYCLISWVCKTKALEVLLYI